MKLVVTAHELHYDGKAHLRGETFHAPEKHAQLLKLLKKAADAPVEPAKPVGQVKTTQPAPLAPVAEPEPLATAAEVESPATDSVETPAPDADASVQDDPAPTAPTRSRNYQRRDLTAED